MAETTRRGFHGLEERIHELEAEDRKAPERERERERKLDEAEVAAAEIKPPPAHEE
jgi:hypothetical protein